MLEAGAPTRYTPALAASLFYQGVVVAGFNFVVNSRLFQVYRPSALATCSLTTPIFGVLVAAAIAGDQLTRRCSSRPSWSRPASASPSAADASPVCPRGRERA